MCWGVLSVMPPWERYKMPTLFGSGSMGGGVLQEPIIEIKKENIINHRMLRNFVFMMTLLEKRFNK
jgi:hypothetical protein